MPPARTSGELVQGRSSEIVFRAQLDSRLPIRIDPLEHDDWGWFTLAEANEKIRWTDDREALELYRSRFT